jgi:hypothetical protein
MEDHGGEFDNFLFCIHTFRTHKTYYFFVNIIMMGDKIASNLEQTVQEVPELGENIWMLSYITSI